MASMAASHQGAMSVGFFFGYTSPIHSCHPSLFVSQMVHFLYMWKILRKEHFTTNVLQRPRAVVNERDFEV